MSNAWSTRGARTPSSGEERPQSGVARFLINAFLGETGRGIFDFRIKKEIFKPLRH